MQRKLKRPLLHCRKCGKDRLPESFAIDKTRKTGHYPTCRFCVREANRLRRLKNLPKARARERAASQKCWDKNPHVRAYHYIRGRAKAHGIKFTLTPTFLKELFAIGKCAFCDRKISPRARAQKDRASVDKLIPSRGYTPRNVVLACGQCNRKKDNSSPAELRMLADGIERLLLNPQWRTKS